jgi:hypothetical protein
MERDLKQRSTARVNTTIRKAQRGYYVEMKEKYKDIDG